MESKLEIITTKDDTYSFVIDISTGAISFEDIVSWLQQYTQSL